MKTTFSKILSCILALSLILSLGAITALAESDTSITCEQDIINAIDAIPVGSSGEVNIEDVIIGLSTSIYIENKDVTFNLKRATLSTFLDNGFEFGCPVIFGYNANITINADETSTLLSQADTGMMGTVRIDTGYDWVPETESFTGTNYLTINGGNYTCAENDAAIIAAPGTKVTLNNVVCNGTVEAINYEGVGIEKYGELIINGGIFTTDVRKYAADGKFSCAVGNKYYVRDKETTDEFASLVPNNTITFDYATPTSKDDEALFLIAETLYEENSDLYFDPMSFSDDFKTCEIGINMDTAKEEVHAVNVKWNYNGKVLDVAKTYIENFPTDRNWFTVSDLELVNYYANYNPDAENESFANYSGELKAIFNNANFTLEVETRGGGDAPFYTETIGSAKLMHDGKVYFSAGMLGARGEHLFYVPENTASTKDALTAAVQKRIDDYIGKGKIKVTAKNHTVTDYYNEEIARYDEQLADAQTRLAAEMAKPDAEKDWFVIMDCQYIIDTTPTYKQQYIESYQDGGDHAFLNKAEGGFVFSAEVNGKDVTFDFIVDKDDDKLAVPTFATVDLNTNVLVTTNSSTVPLDTSIMVEKPENTEIYEKTIESLNATEVETFDIKLHSTSLNDYVEKLDNGNFIVQLPISKELEDKVLAVYYIGDDGKAKEYEVDTKSNAGFATFETNHFSVYSLAIKATPGGVGESEAMPEPAPTPDIPKTGDSTDMVPFAIIAIIAVLGIFGSIRFGRKRTK